MSQQDLEGQNVLAVAFQHHQAGRLEEAEQLYRGIIESTPDHADALYLLGALMGQRGRHEDAAGFLEAAVSAKPDHPDFHANLGNSLHALGRYEEAAAACRRALELKPDQAEIHNNLGNSLAALDDTTGALEAFDRALSLRPDFYLAHANRGHALWRAGRLDDAEKACRRAIEGEAELAIAQLILGNCLSEQDRIGEADAAYSRALEIDPRSADAHNNLGMLRIRQCRLEDARSAYLRALKLDPDNPEISANLVFLETYLADSPNTQLDLARDWCRRFAKAPDQPAPPFPNTPNRGRRLRVGYVSTDFRHHPVGNSLSGVLVNHDKETVEVFCYANHRQSDDRTAELRACADHWRVIDGVPDAVACRQISDDGIDILVDLIGHCSGNRLALFAARPAPVQATWLGYFASTGLDAMDYVIADEVVIRPREEHLFTETVVRLSDSYLHFSPPAFDLEAGPPPAGEAGFVTFGSLNRLAKINTDTLGVWAEILRRVPGSRLLVRSKEFADTAFRAEFLRSFEELGLATDRIDLEGGAPYREFLDTYRRVDIALDSILYQGGVTTFEALWMGVPVVSLAGDRMVRRPSVTILRAAGLDHLTADSADDYIRIAVELAADIDGLTSLRRQLRGQILASPVGDAARFTRGLEGVYRDMWHRWCETRT